MIDTNYPGRIVPFTPSKISFGGAGFGIFLKHFLVAGIVLMTTFSKVS
jgi:hypothetical protein